MPQHWIAQGNPRSGNLSELYTDHHQEPKKVILDIFLFFASIAGR